MALRVRVARTQGRRRSRRAGSMRPHFSVPRLRKRSKPGAVAGIELSDLARMPEAQEPVSITCIDYGPQQAQVQEVTDLAAFLAAHRPEWSTVRWINVDGLSDLHVVRALAEKYHLHPLAIEDVLHVTAAAEGRGLRRRRRAPGAAVHHRAHARAAATGTCTASRSASSSATTPCSPSRRAAATCGTRIRQRIQTPGSRLRPTTPASWCTRCSTPSWTTASRSSSTTATAWRTLEAEVLQRPSPAVIQEIHTLKRELLLLRRAVWPMREVVSALQREPHECMSDTTRTYMRDVYDHTVQIIDIVETYREMATGLTETYMTAMSKRLNEVMKVLTIIGTIFIPLTFLAGVYGMNFKHFPELEWVWGYPVFWGICVVTAVTMLIWFRRRQWL